MTTPLPAVVLAVALVLAGCSLVTSPSEERTDAIDEQSAARHIEIVVEDLESGLPCSVVDRPDADRRDVLWRAQFERDFCHRKAEETRQILQEQGWACRPLSSEERQDLVEEPTGRPAEPPHVVAAWRCLGGLEPTPRKSADRPHVPTAKPALPKSAASWGNLLLRSAVERDLTAIGQDVIGDQTTVDAALGDLNDDAIEDAIVVLTRGADSGKPHRMLMAYLQNGEAYNLVDVWILKAPDDQGGGKLDVAIEDGKVLLENCCENQNGAMALLLDNRKLAYADGG